MFWGEGVSKDKTAEKIRHAIDNLVADGSKDHVNELANLLLERDADPHFLQDLFHRLS